MTLTYQKGTANYMPSDTVKRNSPAITQPITRKTNNTAKKNPKRKKQREVSVEKSKNNSGNIYLIKKN